MRKSHALTARIRRAMELLSNRKIRDLTLKEGSLERRKVDRLLSTLEEALAGHEEVNPLDQYYDDHEPLLDHHRRVMAMIDMDEDEFRMVYERGLDDGEFNDDNIDYFIREVPRE